MLCIHISGIHLLRERKPTIIKFCYLRLKFKINWCQKCHGRQLFHVLPLCCTNFTLTSLSMDILLLVIFFSCQKICFMFLFSWHTQLSDGKEKYQLSVLIKQFISQIFSKRNFSFWNYVDLDFALHFIFGEISCLIHTTFGKRFLRKSSAVTLNSIQFKNWTIFRWFFCYISFICKLILITFQLEQNSINISKPICLCTKYVYIIF